MLAPTAVSYTHLETNFLQDTPDLIVQAAAEENPMGRNAPPADVVPAMAFLLSDEAGFILSLIHICSGILGRAADGVARLDEQHTAKPGLGHEMCIRDSRCTVQGRGGEGFLVNAYPNTNHTGSVALRLRTGPPHPHHPA